MNKCWELYMFYKYSALGSGWGHITSLSQPLVVWLCSSSPFESNKVLGHKYPVLGQFSP